MAPVVKALNRSPLIRSKVCVSAQHREMLDQVLDLFSIKPNYDLNVMAHGQSLGQLTNQVINGLQPIIDKLQPDRILVHGDTTTAFASALTAFYNKIPVGHIEAGLRTQDMQSPYPEEMNRRLIDSLCDLHFAPTKIAADNLKRENIKTDNIKITGNTVIDSLFHIKKLLRTDTKWREKLNNEFSFLNHYQYLILFTGHRRENFGQSFHNIFFSLKELASRANLGIVYPVHLNPKVHEPAYEILSNCKNIHLIPPIGYGEFVYLMERAHFLISDSGGIQEEAPSLGKPVLVTRKTTERPEALESGTIILVGAKRDKLINEATKLLDDSTYYRKLSKVKNLFGNGNASKTIVEEVINKSNDNH